MKRPSLRWIMVLLVEDLQQRPWATHSQRAVFFFAACGVSVSEATICRTLRVLAHILRKLRARTKEALIEAMDRALGALSTQDARGLFTHCGYRLLAQRL